MFDQQPEERRFPSWLLKLFVISACAFGVGSGLCGLDRHLYPNAEFGGSLLALFGAGLLVLAVLGLGVVVLVLLVTLVTLIFPR